MLFIYWPKQIWVKWCVMAVISQILSPLYDPDCATMAPWYITLIFHYISYTSMCQCTLSGASQYEPTIWHHYGGCRCPGAKQVPCHDMCLHFNNYAGIILCMRPANERRRYNVTSSLIGWAHTQNDPCCDFSMARIILHNITLSKQLRCQWFEMTLCSLWSHCDKISKISHYND